MTVPPSSSGPPSPAAKGTNLRRRLLLVTVLLLPLAGMVGVWWWLYGSLPPPPLPANIQENEVQEAISQARQRVLAKPRSAPAWGHYAKVLLAHLFDREADVCFAQAARLDPSNPLWPHGRGIIALKRDPDQAITLLRQAAAAAMALPEPQLDFVLQLADALLERGLTQEAEDFFQTARQYEPDNPRAAFGLGVIALARNDEAAVKYLMRARASPPGRKKATAQLALWARAQGKPGLAATYEKEAAKLADDPPWPDPLLDEVVGLQVGRRGRERLIAQLELQNNFPDAAKLHLAQLEKQPTVQAYLGAGINLARLRDFDRALPLLREAVRLEPNNAHALYSLALGLFTCAEREWHASPKSPRAQKFFAETVEYARRATERRPDHAAAYLFWGLALKYLDDPKGAVVPLRKGIACAPENFELQYGLGEVLLQLGQTEEAKTHMENARRIKPTDPRLRK